MGEDQKPYGLAAISEENVVHNFMLMIGRVSAMRQVLEELERELHNMLKAHLDAYGSPDD